MTCQYYTKRKFRASPGTVTQNFGDFGKNNPHPQTPSAFVSISSTLHDPVQCFKERAEKSKSLENCMLLSQGGMKEINWSQIRPKWAQQRSVQWEFRNEWTHYRNVSTFVLLRFADISFLPHTHSLFLGITRLNLS